MIESLFPGTNRKDADTAIIATAATDTMAMTTRWVFVSGFFAAGAAAGRPGAIRAVLSGDEALAPSDSRMLFFHQTWLDHPPAKRDDAHDEIHHDARQGDNADRNARDSNGLSVAEADDVSAAVAKAEPAAGDSFFALEEASFAPSCIAEEAFSSSAATSAALDCVTRKEGCA